MTKDGGPVFCLLCGQVAIRAVNQKPVCADCLEEISPEELTAMLAARENEDG